MQTFRKCQKPIPYSIVLELVEIRKAWNIDQKDLAKMIGVNPYTMIKMETGNYTPSIAMMMRWTGAMGYELSIKQKK